MKYAVYVPHFGDCADPCLLADLAREAEKAGWDGFFIWDHVALDWPDPVADVTVALTAIALNTHQLRFGALVTPLPRRRPWKFAREMASLDRISGGRLVAGVGIGVFQAEFDHLGETPDPKTRAAMLDEGLEVLAGLWHDGGFDYSFSYQSTYYQIEKARFWPTPIQKPRIPIWVAATWPHRRPLRRAARWDGVVPMLADGDDLSMMAPQQVREMVSYIRDHRPGDEPFDIVIGGITPGEDRAQAAAIITPYVEVGMTWWKENLIPLRFGWKWGPPPWPMDAMRERIQQGPPRV